MASSSGDGTTATLAGGHFGFNFVGQLPTKVIGVDTDGYNIEKECKNTDGNKTVNLAVMKTTKRVIINISGGEVVQRQAKRPNDIALSNDQREHVKSALTNMQTLYDSGVSPSDLQDLLFPDAPSYSIVNCFLNEPIDISIVNSVPVGLLAWDDAETKHLLDDITAKQHAELGYDNSAPNQVLTSYRNHSMGGGQLSIKHVVEEQARILPFDEVALFLLECKRWQKEWRVNMSGDGKLTCFRCAQSIPKSEVSPEVVATRRVILQALLMNKRNRVASNGPLTISLGLSWSLALPEIFKPKTFAADNIMAVMPCCKGGSCNFNEPDAKDFDDRVICLANLLAKRSSSSSSSSSGGGGGGGNSSSGGGSGSSSGGGGSSSSSSS
jgi:uncharacterized membrane protein YgcG